MKTELVWEVNPLSSLLHGVETLLSGRSCVEARFSDWLRPVVEEFQLLVANYGIEARPILEYGLGLTATTRQARELAEVAVAKSVALPAHHPLVSELAAFFTVQEKGLQKLVPGLEKELALRARPLREHWEARGPGFLAEVARLTDETVQMPRAVVLLAYPFQGGGGGSHATYNAFRLEPLLANPEDRLPEPLRLGWLLSQMNLDLPRFAEVLPSTSRERVPGLAMLRVAIAAGATVQWCEDSTGTTELALATWLPEEADRAATAELLEAWWRTHLNSRPRFEVALAGLAAMLEQSPTTGAK